MKNTFIKLTELSCNGYIPIRRDILSKAIEGVKKPSEEILYVYLLLNANFEKKVLMDGRVLERGDFLLDLDKFSKFSKLKKSSIYSYFQRLTEQGLIVKKGRSTGIYHLVYYEEQCGCNAGTIFGEKRKSPKRSSRNMEETTDSAFNFENFYNFYHEMLGIPFNEREKARREWTLLSSEEQIKAINCVKAYAQSIRNPEHIKYACNYLRDKTYETYVNPSDYE